MAEDDNNNPFEDPSVQAAASGTGPPPVPSSYNQGGGAYDDNVEDVDINDNKPQINQQQQQQPNRNKSQSNQVRAKNDSVQIDINKYVSPQQQQQIAVNAGSSMANTAFNAAKDDYKQATATQVDQHAAPDKPDWCIKCFNWFPLKLFCFFGGALLIVMPILDIAFSSPEFITFFIYLYLVVFGIITMIVESPIWKLSRWMQLKIFFWFRILSRMWGRAWFYLFISILCYSELDSRFTATAAAGFWLTFMCIFSFFYSKLACAKYVRIYDFIAAGTEGDELIGKFMRKFDELDADGDGRIGSLEIVKVAEQAGRELSNAERQAIQTFLDESCNGYVSKEDWMKQWMEHNKKQKFL